MEVTVNKNIKFTQTQMQQIEKAIIDYNFKNVSEVVREGVKIFFKFLEIKDKFEDPNVSRKFVEETEELLQAEKEFDRLQACSGKFTDEELENEIALLVTPDDIQADVEIVYQSIDNLHASCPNHLGDWYFSGNYPTPGGNQVVNRSFVYFMQGSSDRAY